MTLQATTALANVTLTTAYSGNQSAAIVIRSRSPVLFVKYTNGDETDLRVQLEISDDGGTTWYLPTTSAGVSLAVVLTVTATGNYRVNLPLVTDGNEFIGNFLSSEQRVRISVLGTSASGSAGTATVTIAGDS